MTSENGRKGSVRAGMQQLIDAGRRPCVIGASEVGTERSQSLWTFPAFVLRELSGGNHSDRVTEVIE